MTLPDEMDSAVRSAVRRFLLASIAGRDEQEAAAAVIAETSVLPLTRLEAWEGALRAEAWDLEAERRAVQWKFWRRPHRLLSWLDLCSRDGYRRERMLRALSDRAPNGFFCSLAVRRLNDWVPQVRAAARERLPVIASRSDPEHVADALWATLPHWSTWNRLGDGDRYVLSNLISIEGVASALKSRIISATAGATAAVLAQAGRSAALDRWLNEIATNAIQPSVRAKAYRSLLEGRIVWVAGWKWVWIDKKWGTHRLEPVLGERALEVALPFVELLRSASADGSPLVRRVAGDMLIQRLDSAGDQSARIAEQLAADPFPSIAERGRFVLTQLGRRS